MDLLMLIGGVKLWDAPLTHLLIIITCLTTYQTFEGKLDKSKMLFYPYYVQKNGEWYRFISHGFIHANWMHAGFNMFALYLFGAKLEIALKYIFSPTLGPFIFLFLYFSGLVMASMYDFYKHKDYRGYAALGASGAVSSVVFASILIDPVGGIGLILISDITGIFFPGFLFGIAYLAYSNYMGKHGNDNIGHDAHFWGAVWGLVFMLAIKPILGLACLEQIKYYVLSFF